MHKSRQIIRKRVRGRQLSRKEFFIREWNKISGTGVGYDSLPVVLINRTVPVAPALVGKVPPNTPLEETLTAW